jgi:hypothetical protein
MILMIIKKMKYKKYMNMSFLHLRNIDKTVGFSVFRWRMMFNK